MCATEYEESRGLIPRVLVFVVGPLAVLGRPCPVRTRRHEALQSPEEVLEATPTKLQS